MNAILRIGVLLGLIAVASSAVAQSYPSRPIKMMVGFGTGGVTDVVARLAAGEMSKRLGQPVVVENRVGASGLLAASAVAKSPADGYTVFAGSAIIIHPLFLKDNALDAAREMSPVSVIAYGDWVFYIRGTLPFRTIAEIATYAKANPGKLNFGSPSAANDLLMKMVANRAGFTYTTIPYKATDQTITALLAGDIDMTSNALTGFPSHMQAGTIRALMTLSPTRSALLPDVPTAAELGLQNMDLRSSNTFWVAPGTAPDILAKLAAAWTQSTRSADVIEQLRKLGQTPGGTTPEEARRIFDSDVRFYTEAARLANYQPQ